MNAQPTTQTGDGGPVKHASLRKTGYFLKNTVP